MISPTDPDLHGLSKSVSFPEKPFLVCGQEQEVSTGGSLDPLWPKAGAIGPGRPSRVSQSVQPSQAGPGGCAGASREWTATWTAIWGLINQTVQGANLSAQETETCRLTRRLATGAWYGIIQENVRYFWGGIELFVLPSQRCFRSGKYKAGEGKGIGQACAVKNCKWFHWAPGFCSR